LGRPKRYRCIRKEVKKKIIKLAGGLNITG